MEIIKITSKCKKYPKRLKSIKDYPKELYAIGDITILDKPCVSIVGSRDIDQYGIDQTKRFASFLAQKDICIVSGLAKGVDTVAHCYSKDKIRKNSCSYCLRI